MNDEPARIDKFSPMPNETGLASKGSLTPSGRYRVPVEASRNVASIISEFYA
jgi:hypothetical protein